jgi:hypothetical protein
MNGFNFVDPWGLVVTIDPKLRNCYKRKIEKIINILNMTESGRSIYKELHEDKEREYMITFGDTGGGEFEIISDVNGSNFVKSKMILDYSNISRNAADLISQGEPISDSKVKDYAKKNMSIENYNKFKSRKRFKGLKNKYYILAEILGHEMKHAQVAKKDPGFYVKRYKRLKFLSKKYINDYLHKRKRMPQFKAEEPKLYQEFMDYLESISIEEFRETYPFEFNLYKQLKEVKK